MGVATGALEPPTLVADLPLRVIHIIVDANAFSIVVLLSKSSVIILQKVVVVFLWDVTVVVRVKSEINDAVQLAIRETRCVNSLSYIAKPM